MRPAFSQTIWFMALCIGAAGGLLWAAHILRQRRIPAKLHVRLEERSAERARIARELHDTLLQSFQGVLLRLQAAMYLISEHPAEAVKTLEAGIEEARAAINEGRAAVQGLRSATLNGRDFAQAIAHLGAGFAAEPAGERCPEFRVEVTGASKDIAPFVRDEVYRIASEALCNAFRHAQARRIEVDIRYEQRHFQLRVRDDGKGIDPAVLSAGGHAGHHGLPGIHERAELAGGKLSVWEPTRLRYRDRTDHSRLRRLHYVASGTPLDRKKHAGGEQEEKCLRRPVHTQNLNPFRHVSRRLKLIVRSRTSNFG
jgi:signal transduction histidine kinase